MPPHCDALDGPVVNGARQALSSGDATFALRFVPEQAEAEARAAFDQVRQARTEGLRAREVADRYFYETIVRLHRAGEGAPFTGLKPAGLDHGPVLPVAERAIQTASPDELTGLLANTVAQQVKRRLDRVMALQPTVAGGLAQARAYTDAVLGLEVYANTLYQAATTDPHTTGHVKGGQGPTAH